METYSPMFISSSSPPPFAAMNMVMGSHHHPHHDDDHQELDSSEFLGLQMLNMEPQGVPSSSNNTNISSGIGSTGCNNNDSWDKGFVFEAGSEDGQTTEVSVGRMKKREDHQANRKTPKGKVRKPRFAFQTRSHVDILDDGYRWRKYGQKAVKNNKFPRSYYRCTFQGCNVKKQVQRLTKDEGVVVTTYEGVHSHPIEKSTDNFEHILSQFKIYNSI